MSGERVEVAAAVIERPDGAFLMARRPAGKAYAGWWEFPGGKVEVGESARAALDRELREELGIDVVNARPWLNRAFDNPHAQVMLRFFRVDAWHGEPHPHEGQALAWTHAESPEVTPILPANGPILKGLRLPWEYAISNAEALGEHEFLKRLEYRLATGLKLLQWREKEFPPSDLARLTDAVAARCREAGALLMLNADIEQARALGVGVHLNSSQLMRAVGRPDLVWVGASCHDPAELARAAELELDFVVLSPVLPTPSHPGAETVGWRRFAEWLRDYPLPVFALGGLTAADLDRVRALGGHGVALKSQAWSAA